MNKIDELKDKSIKDALDKNDDLIYDEEEYTEDVVVADENLDDNEVWKLCLTIYNGYKELGIDTMEQLNTFLKTSKALPNVKERDKIIFSNVLQYYSETNEKLKKQHQLTAIFYQNESLKQFLYEQEMRKKNISMKKRQAAKTKKNRKNMVKRSKRMNRKH